MDVLNFVLILILTLVVRFSQLSTTRVFVPSIDQENGKVRLMLVLHARDPELLELKMADVLVMYNLVLLDSLVLMEYVSQ
jgi:hydrogenase-4 membrane subunit HyfE